MFSGENAAKVLSVGKEKKRKQTSAFTSCEILYEVVSKILWTGAAIYTAVVVARSTGLNRPNCEFRVLLRSFAATV
jgi:hypothetical protein